MSTHDDTHASGSGEPPIAADEALRRLADGNARFLRGESRFTGMRREDLDRLATGQQPFATVLGCADSRVPPELIFDAVLGELFVIRVAGNVLSAEVAGSMQYAGAHLRTPLFVVLGHEGCGAVSAALESQFDGVQHRSRIQILVESILPALQGVGPQLPPAQRLSAAVEANVRWTVQVIADSPEGRARIHEGRMRLVGAIYELTTGRVRFLDDAR
jgi:carbonic anhydrase